MTSTPRLGHAPIAMRRVAGFSCIEHVGDFAWTDHGGVRHLLFTTPRVASTGEQADWMVHEVPVQIGSNSVGRHWGWDGDEERPTLTPSVHCLGFWHGWVRAGMLVEA